MPKIKIQGQERDVTLKELRELGGQLNQQIQAGATEFQERKGKRDKGENVEVWPADSRAKWDGLNADYNECARALQEENAAAEVAARAAEVAGQAGGRQPSEDAGADPPGDRRHTGTAGGITAEVREVALRAWFRAQSGLQLSAEEIEAGRRVGLNPRAQQLDVNLCDTRTFRALQQRVRQVHPERRDLSAVTGNAGAYTIPEGFVNQIEMALLYFGPMLEASQVITTDQGNDLPYPTVTDTGNVGVQLGESTTIGDSVDPTFGAVVLKAYKFSSKLVKVPIELLEDSAFDLVTWLGMALGERLGRILNTKTTTGDGNATCTGILTAATLGKTTASPTAIDETELIDLYHSVDRAYRFGPNVGWMMHDLIAAEIRKLQTTAGDFYLSGLANGEPDSIMQKRLWFNNDLPSTVAANNKTALFGDFSKYLIRRVRGIRLRRLVERYADLDQEGFVVFLRADGALIDAGTHPVKYLKQHA